MNKTTLSCIAVDDEPMALKLIEGYITKTPSLELKGTFSNAIDALDNFNENPIDLLFLDIQMPDLSGMELSKIVKDKTKVIFTTAFDHYALEGYKVDAVDYLLKPFDYAEFLSAVQKAHDRIHPSQTETAKAMDSVEKEFLFVKSGYKQLKIALDQVLYFEGLKDYVKIWIKDNPSPILSLLTLKSLENELPPERFMRVNRSFIVALPYIEEVERNLILINNNQITVSEQHKAKFQEYIDKNSF
ncbi:LytR/AlgR family response regulator transcription factor [Flagellimonas zhangzhouensis]|uniref:Two component transcriptional regulator, LytTR family n=1 Tax=Flagellimonas zhangzhouensis TaxID=1073328 RepID=A0A1H2Y9C5_9FLAO|nr:LytTR family DNA-binding domain-containing protein [Allomuricauda zhangzhouensis]SDQ98082.1 two component transcriptional regulator, LytTR family [Allomuricauda zhangzhouensis]SDX01756.1 two component transcriptional regulator, LytTR family [Allomuricauda zhangzhouensis]